MRYKVTRQFRGAAEAQCAQFKDPTDARFFIEKKLVDDAAMKVSATYRLYEFDEVLAEYDPSKAGVILEQTSDSQGKGSSAGFRPTPFNTAPKPAGMPQKWGKDEDEEKQK